MLGAIKHGLHTLTSAIASALGAKSFAQRVPVHVGTTEFTMGGAPAQGVALIAGSSLAVPAPSPSAAPQVRPTAGTRQRSRRASPPGS